MSVPAVRRALALVATAAALPLHAQPATHAHADPHAGHAPAPRTVPFRGEVSVRAVAGDAAPMERRELEVRLRLVDPTTGRPVTGLDPMAWVDVHAAPGDTPLEICREKVGSFAEAGLHIKHGQINIAQPVEDLNGHYVVALARQPYVAVLDPVKGFGRTRMYTAVPLRAPGVDWTATPDERRLFVAMPEADQVAVLNTHDWKVAASIDVARPVRAAVGPDGRTLWVVGEDGAVTAFDAATLARRGAFRTGAGPFALSFSTDGRWVLVAARDAGTLTVIDAAAMRAAAVPTGPRPVDVAWSDARAAAFVAHEGDGSVVLVDPARAAAVDRIVFEPGLARFLFPPQAGEAHHGSHGQAAAPAGRLGFAVNPIAGTVEIVDVVAGARVRRLSGAPEPDAVGFSPGFAYVRAAGTANVAMIPLHDPTQGAIGPHDYFPAGSSVPGRVAEGLGEVIVPTPGGHDAIYVVNPAERMIYSYHYMEGMPVPHGGLTTYRFEPRAIRTVSRRVREAEPGVYAATFSVDRPGRYDLIVRNGDPHVLGCWGFDVAADPSLRPADAYRIEPVAAGRTLAVGANTLRFRVTDERAGAPVADLADLQVQFTGTMGERVRVRARPVGGGEYEASVHLAQPGPYYVSFESARLEIGWRDRSPIPFAARADGR